MFVKLWHKNSHRWPIASRLWPHRPPTGMESHRGQNGSHGLGFKLSRTAQFCARIRKRNGLKAIRRQDSVCSTSFVTWPLQKVFLKNETKPHQLQNHRKCFSCLHVQFSVHERRQKTLSLHFKHATHKTPKCPFKPQRFCWCCSQTVVASLGGEREALMKSRRAL